MPQSGSVVDHVQSDWTLRPHHRGKAPSNASGFDSGQSMHCGCVPCRPERPFEETQAASAAAAPRRTVSEKWAEYRPGPAEGARGRQVIGPGRPRATTTAQVRGSSSSCEMAKGHVVAGASHSCPGRDSPSACCDCCLRLCCGGCLAMMTPTAARS